MYKAFAVAAAIVMPAHLGYAAVSPGDALQPNPSAKVQTAPDYTKCKKELLGGNSLKMEFLVTCGETTSLFTFSPLDGLYCDAKMQCNRGFKTVIAKHFDSQMPARVMLAKAQLTEQPAPQSSSASLSAMQKLAQLTAPDRIVAPGSGLGGEPTCDKQDKQKRLANPI